MSAIRGYPSKLKIYRIRGSRFWQARCYMDGKMYVRSTRTAGKLQATEAAKHFYEELLARLRREGDGEVDRNSFLRPTDLKFIQHKHVDIVRGENLYLRLNLPETKRHKAKIVTLRPAVRIYQALRRDAEANGCAGPDDYLFLPDVADRDSACVVLSMHFNKILAATGLKQGELGQTRNLYSLRHTAIMFRLLYGKGIDLLTLARNARTSVQMVEEFYASNLTAEMNIGLLQSKRKSGVARND
jgi:hypothetical protein